MLRHIVLVIGCLISAASVSGQWVSGGLFSVFNHFQAAAFQSPDTGVFVYGSDNPISGEGGMIATYTGATGGGFYMWYEQGCRLEDVDVQVKNGFPYYMAAGAQSAYSVIVKPYELFLNPFQFDSVRTGVSQFYRTVRMRTDLVAFAGGGNGNGDGIIDMSLDTGATWVNVATIPGESISKIRFVNDMLAFAVTGGYVRLVNNGVTLPASGKIHRSQDGGMTWTEVFSDATNGFSDIAFSSTTHGIASRNDGQIFRTLDGGSTWSASTMNYNDTIVLTAVTFRPDGVGFATGYKSDGSEGVILISADGGGTWDLDFSTSGLNHARRIYGITFTDIATGYASAHIRPLKSSGISTAFPEHITEDPKVYPNPATDLLEISWNSAVSGVVALLDMTGRVIRTVEAANDSHLQLSVRELDPGQYMLRYPDKTGATTLTFQKH